MRMHIKKIIHVALFFGLCIFGPQSFALEQQNIVLAIQKVDEIIQQHLANKRIPGCAVAVVYGNEIIFMRGYGERKVGSNQKIDSETVFQLGSISKPISASLAAILEAQGYLSLDDPVIAYLPNFRLNSKQHPSSLKITNILSHTSGLTRGGFNNMIESFKSHDEIVDALQSVPVKSKIGESFNYHNAMYGLISDITESATHMNFETALSSYLLAPLQMKNTTANLEGLLNNPNRAYPHTRNKKGSLTALEEYSQGYYTVAPAGGINSSVRDLAYFLKAQFGHFPQILHPKSLNRIHTPYTPTKKGQASGDTASLPTQRISNQRYGLGWRILNYADNKLVYHGGWLKGFTNYLAFMPEHKLGIVILHNADTKFSSKTGLKFFEVALGLPEVKEPPAKAGKASKDKKKKVKKGKKKNTQTASVKGKKMQATRKKMAAANAASRKRSAAAHS